MNSIRSRTEESDSAGLSWAGGSTPSWDCAEVSRPCGTLGSLIALICPGVSTRDLHERCLEISEYTLRRPAHCGVLLRVLSIAGYIARPKISNRRKQRLSILWLNYRPGS